MLFCNFFNISIFSYKDFLSILKYYFHLYMCVYIYISNALFFKNFWLYCAACGVLVP